MSRDAPPRLIDAARAVAIAAPAGDRRREAADVTVLGVRIGSVKRTGADGWRPDATLAAVAPGVFRDGPLPLESLARRLAEAIRSGACDLGRALPAGPAAVATPCPREACRHWHLGRSLRHRPTRPHRASLPEPEARAVADLLTALAAAPETVLPVRRYRVYAAVGAGAAMHPVLTCPHRGQADALAATIRRLPNSRARVDTVHPD